jgi:hypothetical protein
MRKNDVARATQDVTYLHRSVADYLFRDEVWREILRHTEGIDFHAPQSLLKSALMQIKAPMFDPVLESMDTRRGEL